MIKCYICDKEFKNKKSLSNHIRWHDLPKYKSFQKKSIETSKRIHPKGKTIYKGVHPLTGTTRWKDKPNPFLGKKHSIESLKKMSDSQKYPDYSTRYEKGYKIIKIKSKWMYEHKYIFLSQGEWNIIPKNFVIHHINGIKDDNRIENLSCIPRSVHMSLHRTVVT